MSVNLLNLCGNFQANVTSSHGSSEKTFYVTMGSSNSILSWSTSQKLNLLTAVSAIDRPSAIPSTFPASLRTFPILSVEWMSIKVNQYVYMLMNLSSQLRYHIAASHSC